LSLKEEWLIGN